MGIVKKLKQGAKKLADQFGSLVQEGVDVVNNQSRTHIEVQKLHDKVESILKQNSKAAPEVKEAAKGFLSELNIALQEDSNQTPFNRHRQTSQYNLAEKCIDIIYKYKPQLESAPGFWNQLKSHINNFIEKVTGEKDVLSTKGTEFSANTTFQEYKAKIANLKEQMDPDRSKEIEPEEPDRGFRR